jgi:uncharacterized protein YndB with AHSA1/START domain
MTERSVVHGGFTIERVFDAPLPRVFRAFSDPKDKVRWACHEDWRMTQDDIRVGGWEVSTGGDPGGPAYTFRGLYQDIVENERMVISYTMDKDDVRISVSTMTLEFTAEGPGTKLTFTDWGAFLDGHDSPAAREQGSGVGLDNLAALLARENAVAVEEAPWPSSNA